MEKRIWKYQLSTISTDKIQLPKGYEILTVQMQHGILCLWVLINSEAELVDVTIEKFTTGELINYGMGTSRQYIGTYQLHGGSFIGHVFEYTGI